MSSLGSIDTTVEQRRPTSCRLPAATAPSLAKACTARWSKRSYTTTSPATPALRKLEAMAEPIFPTPTTPMTGLACCCCGVGTVVTPVARPWCNRVVNAARGWPRPPQAPPRILVRLLSGRRRILCGVWAGETRCVSHLSVCGTEAPLVFSGLLDSGGRISTPPDETPKTKRANHRARLLRPLPVRASSQPPRRSKGGG